MGITTQQTCCICGDLLSQQALDGQSDPNDPTKFYCGRDGDGYYSYCKNTRRLPAPSSFTRLPERPRCSTCIYATRNYLWAYNDTAHCYTYDAVCRRYQVNFAWKPRTEEEYDPDQNICGDWKPITD